MGLVAICSSEVDPVSAAWNESDRMDSRASANESRQLWKRVGRSASTRKDRLTEALICGFSKSKVLNSRWIHL
jgi:hypothetical protein